MDDPAERAEDALDRVELGALEKGRALGRIVDDLGARVGGATVTGTFTGAVTGTFSATPNADGVAVLTALEPAPGPVAFSFCVDAVSHPSLSYDPSANVQTCANRTP